MEARIKSADYNAADAVQLAFFATGLICALRLRVMAAGPSRGWTKLAAFLLIAAGLFAFGIADIRHQQTRAITPIQFTGTLTNLHTETSGPRSSPTQHYNILSATTGVSPDLHDEDALFFMKAQNGEHVDVTFTQETGYVTHLQVLDGVHAGYAFSEPDTRNLMPATAAIILGCILAVMGILKWIVDRNADPALTD